MLSKKLLFWVNTITLNSFLIPKNNYIWKISKLKFAFSLFKNTFPKFLTFSKVTPTSDIKKFARMITMKNILKYHTIQIIAMAKG